MLHVSEDKLEQIPPAAERIEQTQTLSMEQLEAALPHKATSTTTFLSA